MPSRTPFFFREIIFVSDPIAADLVLDDSDARNLDGILFHSGEPVAVLHRWRQRLREASPRGWDAVKEYAADVMKLIAQPKILYLAALALRSRGPKSPGRNGLRLESLCGDELWEMSTVLGRAIATGTYRPGPERVIWIEKASGNGERPLVLMEVQDRVVQKAAALVLRPVFDPQFDPLSFAYRPWRKREQAVAVAEQLATQGHFIWLTHDIVDAYGSVSVPRLLDVFYKLLPCPRLRDFLELVLPPQSPKLSGIKQGGPLSSLGLELYLTHFLHVPWRKAGHPVRVIRYADDLLLTAVDEESAKAADSALRELLAPSGMVLKHSFDEARRDIRYRSAQWLGYRFRLHGAELSVKLGSHAFEKLGRRFVLAHDKDHSVERAVQILKQWVAQLGPCYRWQKHQEVCTKAILTAHAYGFEETLAEVELVERWEKANTRWEATRTLVGGMPGYLATGPLEYPTPTSVVW